MIAIDRRAARIVAAALLLVSAAPAAHAQSARRWLKSTIARATHDSTADSTRASRASAAPGAASATSTAARVGALAKEVAGDTPLGMEVKLAKTYGGAIRTQFAHHKRYGGTALEMLDPATAAAAEKSLLAQGFTLQSVSLQHLDPKAMEAIAPVLSAALDGPRGGSSARAATSKAPATARAAADDDADKQMLAMSAELQQLNMSAAAGDTLAAHQLVRYQQEMTGAALRLQAAGDDADATREMRRALDCAKTGRGCRTKSTR